MKYSGYLKIAVDRCPHRQVQCSPAWSDPPVCTNLLDLDLLILMIQYDKKLEMFTEVSHNGCLITYEMIVTT